MKLSLISLLLLLFSSSLIAKEIEFKVIDLSKSIESKKVRVMHDTPFRVAILNMNGSTKYSIEIQVKNSIVTKLDANQIPAGGIAAAGAGTFNDTLQEQTLKKGQKMTVTIIEKDSDPLKKWKYTFSTGSRGSWQTSFGASFITGMFNEEQLYTTRQQGNLYCLVRESTDNTLRNEMSVFFSWMPTRNENRDGNFSLSAGLGINIQDPTVFLGASYSFNQNIKVIAGLAGHKQRRLKGEYSPDVFLNESKNSDELHREIYTYNPFISVTFRFNQNPFKKSDNE